MTTWAADKPDIEGMWLVGSHAWGAVTPDTEVDIYINAPADAYAVGTIYDDWERSLVLATGLPRMHLLSDAVPFRLKGRDPERDGIPLYKRSGMEER